jgi:Glycogen debranching enzyme N terminal
MQKIPRSASQEYGKAMSDSTVQTSGDDSPSGGNLGEGDVHFRVWAPGSQEVKLSSIVRKVSFSPNRADESEFDRQPEWLVANGLGGYACGTVSGDATRRYHDDR